MKRLEFSGRRLPVILQAEQAECGLACLAMLARWFGHDVDVAALRQRFELGARGASIEELAKIASALKLNARPLRTELDELKDLQTPCILHWDLNHAVVLREAKRGRAVIHDPARGKRTLPLAEVSKHYTGVAMELSPAAGFAPVSQKASLRIMGLMRSIRGLGSALSRIFAISFAVTSLSLLSPYYTMLLIDYVLPGRDEDLLSVIAIGFLLLMVMELLIGALRHWASLHMELRLRMQLDGNLFQHLMRLPVRFFESRHLGDIVSRFESMRPVQDVATMGVVQALMNVLLVIGALALMFAFHPMLTGIVLAVFFIATVVRIVLYFPMRGAVSEMIVREAHEKTSFLESARAAQPIKLFGFENMRTAQYMNRVTDTLNARIRMERFGLASSTTEGILTGAEYVIIFWIGVQSVLNAEWTVGALMAFTAWRSRFSGAAEELVDLILQYRMTGLHLNRLADVALNPAEEPAGAGSGLSEHVEGKIELYNVHFRYSDFAPWVLEAVNFEVAPGECVALAGLSGGGKTTLLKVMLGLLHPQAGEVRFDGREIKKIGLGHYRRALAAVMQEDQLLSGSILENITFFDPQPNQEWARDCAAAAGLRADIEAMPMGFRTPVGDLGSTLSGGQKQRLLLARALYKRPRVLFLDEATSHLDPETEATVHQAIKALAITRVVVAHRRETLALADRILFVNEGHVIPEVSHLNAVREPMKVQPASELGRSIPNTGEL